ncbi:MAG: tetratricopeptide repeat protein, partial [Steroidobacteraceae bacterium]
MKGLHYSGRVVTAAELDTQLTRAAVLLEEGNLAQAETSCQAVLTDYPDNPAAMHLLGLIRVRGGDARVGEELIRRSVELDPADTRLRLNLATFLRRAGRLSEAERVYRRVLQRAPEERAARHGLALTLDGLGQSREAELQCRSLIEADRSSPDGWVALGSVLGTQSRLPEAEAAYRKALLLNPRHAPAHRQLGSLLVRLYRTEEALALLERAHSLGAGGFDLAFSRGRACGHLGRLQQAEEAFAEAVRLRPRHPDAHLNLARVRQMRGDPDFARTLAEAVRQAPDDANLLSVLSGLLLRAGRGDVAEQVLRAELKRSGPVPHLRFLL